MDGRRARLAAKVAPNLRELLLPAVRLWGLRAVLGGWAQRARAAPQAPFRLPLVASRLPFPLVLLRLLEWPVRRLGLGLAGLA